MPAPPNLLDPKLPQLPPPGPQAAKTADQGKSGATAFRRELAAILPPNAEGPKPAVQALQAILPQLPAIPIQAVADKLPRILKTAENSAGIKRLRKALEQKPAATAAPAAPPPGAARLTAVASAFAAAIPALAPAAPAARAPDLSAPAPAPALPSPAMSAAAAPAKPDPVTSANNAKQTPEATPGRPAIMTNSATNIQPNSFPLAVAGPAQATHSPAKSAAISRQIAAALPRITLTNPGNPPALHIFLTPETLGTITIKITQHATGATIVTLTASQPATLAALKHDAQHLEQVLSNAGIAEGNRQVNFQTMPVTATQTSPGLGDAGGQPAGGQPAGGGLGQGNGNAQQQHAGTAFASPVARPIAAPGVESVARPGSIHARSGVDVIA